jgi:hypothetical protein
VKIFIRHGQTAARQRFFAALEAKFNDDSGNKSSEIEVFWLNMRKKHLEKILLRPAVLFMF